MTNGGESSEAEGEGGCLTTL